jgi:hypothetical protein
MDHIKINYTSDKKGNREMISTLRILFEETDQHMVTITIPKETLKDIVSIGQKQGLNISLEK